MRLFLYGHAAGMGAGHYVRSLRIAGEAAALGAECVVTSGGRLDTLPRPEGVDLLPLPPVDGPAPPPDLLAERSRRLRDFLLDWKPDAVLVDLMAFGLGGELVEALLEVPTRFVWGLPYAETRVSPVRNPRLRKALAAYGEVLVYEEKGPMDPVPAYAAFGLPPVVEHVGPVTGPVPPIRRTEPPVIVGLIGSGGLAGGDALLQRFCEAGAGLGARLRFVAGPLADLDRLRAVAGPDVDLVPEAPLEEVVGDASVVVSRVGYNSAYTLMKTDLPVVLVPSTWPEQRQRATALAGLPGVWVADGDLPLAQALAHGPALRELPFRTDGARRAAERLLQAPARAGRRSGP